MSDTRIRPSRPSRRATADGTARALERLCARVERSRLPLALFDFSEMRIVALNANARTALGLQHTDLANADLMQASRAPELVRSLVALVAAQELTDWHMRPLLRTPDTAPCSRAHFRRVLGFGDRVICLVEYSVPDHAADDEADPVAAFERQAAIGMLGSPPEPAVLPRVGDLSSRQWEILSRLLRGQRVNTIARAMYLSPSTVRNHLVTIYRKVGVRSQTELLERLQPAPHDRN